MTPVTSAFVIDDELSAREAITAALRESGVAQVDATPYATEALQWIARNPDGVIVCDLVMPAMDGVSFIERLARAVPGTRIILVSKTSRKMLRLVSDIAVDHGLRVLAALTKPVRAAELGRVLGAARVLPEHAAAPAVTTEDLARALGNGQIEVQYQPIVRVFDGRVTGAEALARWNHPEHGTIDPAVFIPLAETCGQIVDLTRIVAREAIRQLAAWSRQAPHAVVPASVAINISPHGLWPENFVDLLEAWSIIEGVAPEQITLELTESAIPDHPSMLGFLSRARLHGFHLAVDDFGTGHSGLDKLRRFPFGTLKIDQCFVKASRAEQETRAILEASVRLGKELGLRTVAEGVQTAADWKLVRELGCDAAQGYWIAPPLRGREIQEWASVWTRMAGAGSAPSASLLPSSE